MVLRPPSRRGSRRVDRREPENEAAPLPELAFTEARERSRRRLGVALDRGGAEAGEQEVGPGPAVGRVGLLHVERPPRLVRERVACCCHAREEQREVALVSHAHASGHRGRGAEEAARGMVWLEPDPLSESKHNAVDGALEWLVTQRCVDTRMFRLRCSKCSMEEMTTALGFDATLPDTLTDEQLEKLVKWAKETCEISDVYMKGEKLHLIAIRKEPKTARQFQSLLRTSLSNWAVELPPKMLGWLELVTHEDYETRRRAPYEKKPEISSPVEHEPHQQKNPEIAFEHKAYQQEKPELAFEHEPIMSRLRLPVNLLRVPMATRG